MIERFQGEKGKRYLVEALKGSQLVEHNEKLATELAGVGELVAFNPGDKIIEQDAVDNDLYFFIEGKADVLINNRRVGTRKSGETVGEMSLGNATARRVATIVARSNLVALKVSDTDFQDTANKYPQVWKVIAGIVSERLRQRSVFLSQPNECPVLFLGCSTEGLELAQYIHAGFKHDSIDAQIWTNGVFGPSGITIDSLLKEVEEADFAAFIFSPDDKIISRDKEEGAPRDNVIFELGLFMGRLSRERTFIIKEQKSDVKIPTDLLGVTPITYVQKKELSSTVEPVCLELREQINKLGVK